MKNFIKTLFALALGVLMTTGVAQATGERFNTDVRDMDTIMVAKNSCSAGVVDGCWSHSINANVGDTIGVQIYYHNTGDTTATDVAVGLNPNITSASRTTHTIEGGILSYGYKVGTGSAVVNLNSSARLVLVDAKWFPNQSSSGQSVNASSLFGNYGLSVGSVAPGWAGQGTVVARFVVEGIDSNDDNCSINDFDADDTSIDEGQSTDLVWRTTGCDYVDIRSNDQNFNNRSQDGEVSVSPDQSTTYTLYAYPNGGSRTVRVNVDGNNETCSIDEFRASPTSIDRGRSSTLSWDTEGDVDYVTISGFSGERSRSGSFSVSPYNTTTYTLRVYCENGSTRTDTETVSVRNVDTSSAPQAITTVANVLNGTQARLNGIAIPHTTSSNTTAWFEWGVGGSYPNRTVSQNVSLGVNSYPYSDLLSNLTPGVTYTYRAVVQNQYGTAYGAPVSFRTTTPSVVQPVVRTTQTVRNVVVAQSAASLLELRVESNYDRMCVNGLIDYTITYKNISNQTLEKSVLQFTNPTEITYLTASRGEYNVVDRTLTIAVGSIAPGEQGIVTVHARINDTAIRGNLAVATASVVYTNTKTRGQEDATAYSLITVSDDCPNVLGASAFGFGSFLPNTLLGWLLLILVILALIVLARQFQKKPSA